MREGLRQAAREFDAAPALVPPPPPDAATSLYRQMKYSGSRRFLLIGPGAARAAHDYHRMQVQSLPLAPAQQAELDAIYDASRLGRLAPGTRPLRAPHHTVSPGGLVGGLRPDGVPGPGEASLAHAGTLVLDDLPEFRADAIHQLARVLRASESRLARASGPRGEKKSEAALPAKPFMVVATSPDDPGALARAAKLLGVLGGTEWTHLRA